MCYRRRTTNNSNGSYTKPVGLIERRLRDPWIATRSSAAIEKASQGKFIENIAFRNLSAERRDKYFYPEQLDEHGKSGLICISQGELNRIANLMNRRRDREDLATANVDFLPQRFYLFLRCRDSQNGAVFRKVHAVAGLSVCRKPRNLCLRMTADFSLEDVDDAFVYVKEQHE